jgi:hypothetical protein
MWFYSRQNLLAWHIWAKDTVCESDKNISKNTSSPPLKWGFKSTIHLLCVRVLTNSLRELLDVTCVVLIKSPATRSISRWALLHRRHIIHAYTYMIFLPFHTFTAKKSRMAKCKTPLYTSTTAAESLKHWAKSHAHISENTARNTGEDAGRTSIFVILIFLHHQCGCERVEWNVFLSPVHTLYRVTLDNQVFLRFLRRLFSLLCLLHSIYQTRLDQISTQQLSLLLAWKAITDKIFATFLANLKRVEFLMFTACSLIQNLLATSLLDFWLK